MPSHRMGRTTEDIRRELTAIFRELKDPRVQGLISIVRVDVSSDLSYCTVYISAMEGMEHAKQATQGLKSASGYIRRELGQRRDGEHLTGADQVGVGDAVGGGQPPGQGAVPIVPAADAPQGVTAGHRHGHGQDLHGGQR